MTRFILTPRRRARVEWEGADGSVEVFVFGDEVPADHPAYLANPRGFVRIEVIDEPSVELDDLQALFPEDDE